VHVFKNDVFKFVIFICTELIIVLNGSMITSNDFRPIRLAQTENSDSWIDFMKQTGEIKIYTNQGTSVVNIKSLRSDLYNNQFLISLSLRSNQLASFYNCNINDALMLEDTSLANSFLSRNTMGVNGNKFYILFD